MTVLSALYGAMKSQEICSKWFVSYKISTFFRILCLPWRENPYLSRAGGSADLGISLPNGVIAQVVMGCKILSGSKISL
jgi:hypothetical protein